MDLSAYIDQWIKTNGSFLEGVRLYKLTDNPIYAFRFERLLEQTYVDSTAKDHLGELLQAYLVKFPSTNPITAPQSIETKAVSSITEPEAIQSLRKQAIPLHKRYSHLKAQLHQMTIDQVKYTDQDRYAIAKEIMEDILPSTDAIYDQIRHWEKEGELPPESGNPVILATVEKMQKVYSLRPRISRLKSWLSGSKLTAAKRQQYEKELLNKEIELRELEQSLGL